MNYYDNHLKGMTTKDRDFIHYANFIGTNLLIISTIPKSKDYEYYK